jgi:hypothetical protein
VTALGKPAASIAHVVSHPLTAVIANPNTGLREGNRAGEVVAGIRTLM